MFADKFPFVQQGNIGTEIQWAGMGPFLTKVLHFELKQPTVPFWQTHGTHMGPARLSQHWHSSCRGTRTFSSIGHSWPALAPCKSKSTTQPQTTSSQLNRKKSSGQASFLVLFVKVFGVFLLNNQEDYITADSGLPPLLGWFGNHLKYFTAHFDSIHGSSPHVI